VLEAAQVRARSQLRLLRRTIEVAPGSFGDEKRGMS
jgi:hypothetical protein